MTLKRDTTTKKSAAQPRAEKQAHKNISTFKDYSLKQSQSARSLLVKEEAFEISLDERLAGLNNKAAAATCFIGSPAERLNTS